MKKIVLAILILMCLVGCISSPEWKSEKEILNEYSLSELILVPVQNGYITTVTIDGKEIYKGNYSTHIPVPKSFISSRSSGLEYHYVLDNEKNKWYYLTSREGILMFEDVIDGDNDYNDFVCWIKEEIGVNLDGNGRITGLSMSNFQIKPLAMGNTLRLGFGFEVRHVESGKIYFEHIFTNDIRKDYFKDIYGFINTEDDCIVNISDLPRDGHGIPVWSNPYKENGSLCVNWFIVVGGEKRYVADSSTTLTSDCLDGELVKNNELPYGLLVPYKDETNFKWPKEKVELWSAYPNFNKWKKGQNIDPFSNPNQELLWQIK